jgi:hypothetical protein
LMNSSYQQTPFGTSTESAGLIYDSFGRGTGKIINGAAIIRLPVH